MKIYFTAGGLRLWAALKPHRLIPDVEAEISIALDSFDFRPGAHVFNFRFARKPEITFPEQRKRFYTKFLIFAFNKLAGSKRIVEIMSRTVNEMGFLTWDYDRITLNLDKHPEADKLFEKRVPIIGTKIFDYVGIKEILFMKSELVLKPVIHPDELLKHYQEIRDLVAAGIARKETEVIPRQETTAIPDYKQTFSRLLEKVKESPDALQAHVEQELPKLKETAVQIGGKLWDGINYLWDAMRDPAVPKEAKFIAIAALLYFVSPIDLISDFLPGGYADDGLVLSLAVNAVRDILVNHEVTLNRTASFDESI